MITVDGSSGEGGGQILRTSLALSIITGKPFSMVKIRVNRKKPGLQPQHLASVMLAKMVSKAKVTGAEINSMQLTFEPDGIYPGDYNYDIGTAGSATLVLQAVLPALMMANGLSKLTISGGTHNPWGPPFEYLENVFFPIIRQMGPSFNSKISSYGFYPKGGGKFEIEIEPSNKLSPINLLERGKIRKITCTAIISALPDHIATRELSIVRETLGLDEKDLKIKHVDDSNGPGNVVMIKIESENITEIFTGFGQKGVRAEVVAQAASTEAKKYIDSNAPVGHHLADQLLIPIVLAGSGRFITTELSTHTKTNIDAIRRFVDVSIETQTIQKTGNTEISIIT
jgi:RNA 3'-terminal phosphate cyclase (ATP)